MFKKAPGDQFLIAIKFNKAAEISRLVSLGLDVNARVSSRGKTALNYAATKNRLTCVKALLHVGADTNLADQTGQTPLHRAAIGDNILILQALIDGGCAINKQDETGNTALHEASWNGLVNSVKVLTQAGCNANLHNKAGYTALHLACQNGHTGVVELLLDAKALCVAKNSYGETPFHLAARYGHDKVCSKLIKTGANTSEQNNDGDTPLHIAVRLGHLKVTEELLEGGQLIAVKNNVGETARDVAIRCGQKEIAQRIPVSSLTRAQRKKPRPHSVDVLRLYETMTSSEFASSAASPLFVPRPTRGSPPVKLPWERKDYLRYFEWRGKKEIKDKKVKMGRRHRDSGCTQEPLKYEEMCYIEREYTAVMGQPCRSPRLTSTERKARERRKEKGTNSSTDTITTPTTVEKPRLAPVSPIIPNGNPVVDKSSKSREDFEDHAPYDPTQEENEKPKQDSKHSKKSSFFGLFRSSSDPDFHANSRTRRSFSWRKKSGDKKKQPEVEEADNSLPVNGVEPLPGKTLPVETQLEDPVDPLDKLPEDGNFKYDPLAAEEIFIDAHPVNALPGYTLPVEEPVEEGNLLPVEQLPVDPLPPDDPSWKRAKEVWEKNETDETKENTDKGKKHKKDKKKHKKRDESKEERKERKREEKEKKRSRSESRERKSRSRTRSKEKDTSKSSKHKDRDRSDSKHRSKDKTKREGDPKEKHRRRTDSEASNDSKHGHRSRKHKHKHDKEHKEHKHHRKVKQEHLHELDKIELSELSTEDVKNVMDKLDGVERFRKLSRDREERSRDGSREHVHKSHERSHDRSHDHQRHRSPRNRHRRHRSGSREKHMSVDSENSHHSSHCATCQRSLKDFEARQEQCSAEIDTARRSIEHKIQRLEKKFDHQFSSTEKQLDKNELEDSDKEKYQSVVSQLSDEFREVTKKLENRTDAMKYELAKLENTHSNDTKEGAYKHLEEKNRDRSAHRKAVGFRDRCPHLAKSSPILWPSSSKSKEKDVTVLDEKSQGTIRVSQSNALDTLNRNRTRKKEPEGSSSDLSSEDLDERDQDLPEDLFERSFDENSVDVIEEGQGEGTLSEEASEALQVKYRRQIRDMQRRCSERSQTEQESLRKRISELETLLEATRVQKV